MAIESTQNVVVTNNHVIHADGGVLVMDSSGFMIQSNLVEGHAGTGIDLRASRDAILRRNTVSGNGHFGITLFDTQGLNLIEGNEVYGNGWHGVYLVSAGDGMRVLRNEIIDNNWSGVQISDGSMPIILDNTIIGNHQDGLGIFRSTGALVTDNDIESNAWDGVNIVGSDQAIVDDNMVIGNGGPISFIHHKLEGRAIRIVDSENVSVTRNFITDNYRGIRISNSIGGEIRANAAASNDIDVDLFESQDLHIANNTLESGLLMSGESLEQFVHDIVNNTVQGKPLVYLYGVENVSIQSPVGQLVVVKGTNITIVEQTFKNVVAGIQMVYGSDVAVRDSYIGETTRYGIVFGEMAEARVTNNTIFKSGKAGIYAWESTNLSIVDNSIMNGSRTAVRLERSLNSRLLDNRLEGNHHTAGEILDSHDVVVKRNGILNNGRGLDIDSSDFACIERNVFRFSEGYAIAVSSTESPVIKFNIIEEGPRGVRLVRTSESSVMDNTIKTHMVDVTLERSQDALVSGNVFTTGVRISGGDLADFVHQFSSNEIRGRPVVYVEQMDSPTLPEAPGQVIIVNSANVSVSRMRIEGTAAAIQIAYSNHIRVTGTVLDRNHEGVRLTAVGGALVSDNKIRGRGGAGVGVTLRESSGAVVARNEVANSEVGVWMDGSMDVVAERNSVINNSNGIELLTSKGTTLSQNIVAGNLQYGILVNSGSDDAAIRTNRITSNYLGVGIWLSRGGLLRDNLISDNQKAGLQTISFASDVQGPVDAKENWWGHATGPSGGEQDACSSVLAAGLGDAIEAGNGGVCFVPWLVNPTP